MGDVGVRIVPDTLEGAPSRREPPGHDHTAEYGRHGGHTKGEAVQHAAVAPDDSQDPADTAARLLGAVVADAVGHPAGRLASVACHGLA